MTACLDLTTVFLLMTLAEEALKEVSCTVDGEELALGFFWKKPRIDFWFLVDWDPECAFFNEGLGAGGRTPSASDFLAMVFETSARL